MESTCSGSSPTQDATTSFRRPSSSSRPRSAGRASGWCSSRPSRWRPRWSPRTSRASRTWPGPTLRRSFPPGDAAALANAVVEVLGDDERRLAMARAGARARRGALRVAGRRAAARRDLPAGRRVKNGRWRILVPFGLIVLAISLIWWRGPDWHLVRTTFAAASWPWIVSRGRAQPRLGRRPGGCLEHRDP